MVRLGGSVDCDHCGTPALRIVGNTIIIEHIHHGEKHTTVLTKEQIFDKVQSPVLR